MDGRVIQPEWLTGAAKSYNADFYQARIWYQHYRWYGAFGDVFAVKAEKDDDGYIRLYNRIAPSPELIELKRSGQALYSSIEIRPELKRIGKPYQVGLGVTDSPASFGTDRIEFSTEAHPDSFFSAAFALDDMEFSKERKIFDFSRMFGRTPQNPSTPEDSEMTQQELEQALTQSLTSALQPFNDRLQQVEERLSAQPESGNEVQANEQFGTIVQTQVQGLTEQFTPLVEKLDQLIELAQKPSDSANDPQGHSEHPGGDSETPSFSC